MPPKTVKAPRRHIKYAVFEKLFGALMKELPAGRISNTVLPNVINPSIAVYSAVAGNVVERSMKALLKFKNPQDASLGDLLANENHTELTGVLDGPALLSILLATYICEYCESVETSRESFSKLSEEMQLRVLCDTDVFSMEPNNPDPLHLAIYEVLKKKTAASMGNLAMVVHQPSSTFKDKLEILKTTHEFIVQIGGISHSMVQPGPPSTDSTTPVPAGMLVVEGAAMDTDILAEVRPEPIQQVEPVNPFAHHQFQPEVQLPTASPSPPPENSEMELDPPPPQALNNRSQFFESAGNLSIGTEEDDGGFELTIRPSRPPRPAPVLKQVFVKSFDDFDVPAAPRAVEKVHAPSTASFSMFDDDDNMPVLAGK